MKISLIPLIHNPKKVLTVLSIMALLYGYHALKVRMDNRMEVWIPEESQVGVLYDNFIQMFGTEEYILIAFPLPHGLTKEHLLLTDRLSNKLKEESGIRRVWSMTELFDHPYEYVDLFKYMIASSSFAKHMLISPDGKASGIIVLLSDQGIRNRVKLLKSIKDIVYENDPERASAFIAGPTVINAELDRVSQKNAMIYYPILFAICLVMLFIIFRSMAGIIIPSVMMGFALLITVGWMGIFNASLNVITIAVLPLVMVVSVAYSIYFYNDFIEYYTHVHNGVNEAAITHAFNKISVPLFLSALTTAIGFLSLTASDIKPVRDFGLYAALGVVSTFALSVTFLPLLLMQVTRPNQKGDIKKLSVFLRNAGQRVLNSKGKVLIFFCLISMLAGVGLIKLSVETDALVFFPRNSPIVKAYSFIESNLTALAPVEVVITLPDSSGKNRLPDFETRLKIKTFQESILKKEEIVTSKSIVDVWEDKISAELMEMHSIPNKRLLDGLETATNYFINATGTTTRISVRVKSLASEQFQKIVEYIHVTLKSHFGEEYQFHVTGIVPIIVEMQNQLLKSLMKSFFIALGVIFCIFIFLLKSVKNALVCMVGNLLPIIVIFGFMGWVDIKLSVATVMIGSIAIGIAVDDTVHFIMRLKQEGTGAEGLQGAILETLSSTGKSILCTSMVILCGFLTLCFSGFVPMQNFGLLTGITIIIALLSDLILLPALLTFFKVKL